MSFRIEEKILVNKNQILDFKKFCLNISAKKLYETRIIKSLYLDNNNSDMFTDSVEGVLPRKKIRIRQYPENKLQEFFFEEKISSVEGRFKKNNMISLDHFNYLLNFGIFDNNYGICKPNLVVSYTREYFAKDDVRVTYDANINYNLFKKNTKKNDHNIIVELKTSINKNLNHLIKEFPFQEIRFSKYCNGIEILQNN